ncbi:maleylacetoacetate isomerase [Parasedimentitalea psychrophila]|uniref:Maleylacetoacetate isomerase n=1 Tax=Parasedimentitalea psychrophila TaxID=2997337 RepID=A0A9Y2P7Z4_9RHOB|nr:maleylacetoacetate isomerase [Parasedimentitalea psychrophila]WIY26538.1 maleylacetoacetate isomerase [Parasedimentitalea psychrophila]
MSETVLYDYWRSSASYRLRIALNLAAIPYRAVSVDLVKGEQRSAAHLARNPQGLVPVLEIDGLQLTQSLAILDYLDQTREMGLLPKDPALRVQAQALAQCIAVDLHPVCNLQVVAYAASIAADPSVTREAWMARFIRPGLEAFESLLEAFEQQPYCTGKAPGLADICLMPQLYNARRWGVDFADLPRLVAVDAACSQHPAFAAAHPDAVHGA